MKSNVIRSGLTAKQLTNLSAAVFSAVLPAACGSTPTLRKSNRATTVR